MGKQKETVCKLAGQMELDVVYKDPYVLPKKDKNNMVGMIEAIKEYLRLHCYVMRAPISYLIR